MSTSVASITPQTAPRDFEELKKRGIFQVRTLIERLGGLTTEEQKMGFARMSTDEKVNLALQLLQQFDRANPGAAGAPPPAAYANGTNGTSGPAVPMMGATVPLMAQQPQQPQMQQQQQAPQAPQFAPFQAPMQAPPQAPQFASNGLAGHQQPQQQTFMQHQAPQVAPVDPAALAAAQNAAQATPAATGGRKPRNATTVKEDAPGLGEEVLKLLTNLTQQSQAGVDAVTAALRDTTATTEELRKENSGMREQIKGLNDAYRGVYGVLVAMDARLTQLQSSVSLTTALVLLLAEQVLGAPRQDVFQAAMNDVAALNGVFAAQPAAPGKG